MSYRIFYTLVCAGIFILAGCQGEVDNKQPASPSISAVPPGPNTVGKVMPPDAAPLDQQIYRWLLIEPTSLDANVAIYQAQSGVFAFEGLTWLNHDFELVPGAADRWESSEDGTIWTFYLRKDA
jgi:ABC-type transport system substrate-binding protein